MHCNTPAGVLGARGSDCRRHVGEAREVVPCAHWQEAHVGDGDRIRKLVSWATFGSANSGLLLVACQ